MKIALYNVTTTTQTGGVESFVWELARYLREGYPDCQVDVIGGRAAKDFRPASAAGVPVITRPFIGREKWRRLPLLNRLYGPTKLLERLSFGLATLPLLKKKALRYSAHSKTLRFTPGTLGRTAVWHPHFVWLPR